MLKVGGNRTNGKVIYFTYQVLFATRSRACFYSHIMCNIIKIRWSKLVLYRCYDADSIVVRGRGT